MQYIKIKQAIIDQIESGMLKEQHKLPSERQLADVFKTTRITLREALTQLEIEGLIYREVRRGWFVAPKPLKYDPRKVTEFMDVLQCKPEVSTMEILSINKMLANRQACELLKLPAFSDVLQIEKLLYVAKRPICFAVHYIRADRFLNLLSYDLTTNLGCLYKDKFGVDCVDVHYRLKNSVLQNKKAQYLNATPGSLALIIERTRTDACGDIVDGEVEYWRHDAICFETSVSL